MLFLIIYFLRVFICCLLCMYVVVARYNLVTTTNFYLCFVNYTGSRIEILFVISLLLLREVERLLRHVYRAQLPRCGEAAGYH